jgi:hypothetical protein
MNTKEKNQKQNVGADLENNAPLRKVAVAVIPQYGDIAWLTNENPMDYLSSETASSKFDEDREKKIQAGLPTVSDLKLNGVSINPLLMLLAKWWEIKPARAAIKKLIDAEADLKGIDTAVYLQVNLGKEVDAFAEMQSAIDRIRYAKTYFKPRKPLSDRVITKLLSIDGIVYVVPVAQLEEAKTTFANDKEALKSAIIGFSRLQNSEIEEL